MIMDYFDIMMPIEMFTLCYMEWDCMDRFTTRFRKAPNKYSYCELDILTADTCGKSRVRVASVEMTRIRYDLI